MVMLEVGLGIGTIVVVVTDPEATTSGMKYLVLVLVTEPDVMIRDITIIEPVVLAGIDEYPGIATLRVELTCSEPGADGADEMLVIDVRADDAVADVAEDTTAVTGTDEARLEII